MDDDYGSNTQTTDTTKDQEGTRNHPRRRQIPSPLYKKRINDAQRLLYSLECGHSGLRDGSVSGGQSRENESGAIFIVRTNGCFPLFA